MDDWSGLGQHSTEAACSGTTCPDLNENGICDSDEGPSEPVPGCTYAPACNFNFAATVDDGSCDFTACIALGCTYSEADNFDPWATNDDGSCNFVAPGCLGDLNLDGMVATSDLLMLLSVFG